MIRHGLPLGAYGGGTVGVNAGLGVMTTCLTVVSRPLLLQSVDGTPTPLVGRVGGHACMSCRARAFNAPLGVPVGLEGLDSTLGRRRSPRPDGSARVERASHVYCRHVRTLTPLARLAGCKVGQFSCPRLANPHFRLTRIYL